MFHVNTLVEHLFLCLFQLWKSESCSVMPNSLQPHRLYSPWDSPGQNDGVGSLSLLQGIFPSQGLNPGLRKPQGKPPVLENCLQLLPLFSGIKATASLNFSPPSLFNLCFHYHIIDSWLQPAISVIKNPCDYVVSTRITLYDYLKFLNLITLMVILHVNIFTGLEH